MVSNAVGSTCKQQQEHQQIIIIASNVSFSKKGVDQSSIFKRC
jgi:hypothetical protein